jgi:hypothetical protein
VDKSEGCSEGDYVAMLLPFSDGSGEPVVLGIYSERHLAEARCWRALQRLGYEQPTAVISRPLDLDNEGDDEAGDPAIETDSARSRADG